MAAELRVTTRTGDETSLLGAWIRDARKTQGFSQRELAERSGLSRSYVCDIERGRGTHPSVASMDKLALALGASRTDLLQASGMLEQLRPNSGSADERRMLSLYRDLTEAGQAEVFRYLRFVHIDEHTWTQPAFSEDGNSVVSDGERNNRTANVLPLFGKDFK